MGDSGREKKTALRLDVRLRYRDRHSILARDRRERRNAGRQIEKPICAPHAHAETGKGKEILLISLVAGGRQIAKRRAERRADFITFAASGTKW